MAQFFTAPAEELEGEYTTWTLLWENALDEGLNGDEEIAIHIDDINDNDKLYLSWRDSALKYRFAIKNISDFSDVFLSPSGEFYLYNYPAMAYQRTFLRGTVMARRWRNNRSMAG